MLSEALESLRPLLETSGETELCVFWNGPLCDDSADVRRTIGDLGGSLKVAQRQLTMDQSWYSAVSMATGKYVWTLGDDDGLLPGAGQPLLDELEFIRPDILFLDGAHIELPGPVKISSVLPRAVSDKTFYNVMDALLALSSSPHSEPWLLPLGSLVFAQDLVHGFSANYFGTYHAYFAMPLACSAQKPNPVLRYSGVPTVSLRRSFKTWGRIEGEVYLHGIPRMLGLLAEDVGPGLLELKRSYISERTAIRCLLHSRAQAGVVLTPVRFVGWAAATRIALIRFLPVRFSKLVDGIPQKLFRLRVAWSRLRNRLAAES